MFQEQSEVHLRHYFHVSMKWLWMIFAVFTVVVLIVTLVTFRQTPVYQATARILLESTAPNIVSFADPGVSNNLYQYSQFLQTQINIIKSHTLTKRMLQKLGMMKQMLEEPVQEEPNSWSVLTRKIFSQIQSFLGEQEPPSLSESAQAAVNEDQIIKKFSDRITIVPVQESHLVDVRVTSEDPEQAALIANTLIDAYIEYSLETKASASRNAVSWLVEEGETARKKVADAEAALQQYKEEHAIISVEGRQNIVMQKLADLTTATTNARIKRMTLESQYQEIRNFKKKELSTAPQVSTDPVIQQLKIDLLNLEREYLELLKKFREKHPNVTALKSQITGLRNQTEAEIKRIVASLKKNYEMALAQERTLTKALEEQKREALELNQKTIMYGILEKEVESNQKIYNALLERMKETRVTERLENTNIQIVDQAAIPNSPIAPRKARNILLAIVVGLLISITLAFFLEYWSDKIETPEDFKQHLDMPFLGIIPKVSVQHILPHDKKATKDVIVATIVLIDPQSGISEAYRGLRTHIMFSDFDEEALTHESGSILLFTSPEPSEGKSCTVANLGITMAQSGQKTLILDCDFRKPRVDKIFHLKEKTYGFADILMHSDAQNGVVEVIQHTDIQNLDVISCGTIPSNPSELLSLKKTAGIIKKLGKKYEKILIDSPPVNVVTDPIILSQIVNGVVLIFHGEKTRRNVAQHARDQLREAGATILGGVINNVDMKKVRYHHYYYYYAYHYPKYYREKEDV